MWKTFASVLGAWLIGAALVACSSATKTSQVSPGVVRGAGTAVICSATSCRPVSDWREATAGPRLVWSEATPEGDEDTTPAAAESRRPSPSPEAQPSAAERTPASTRR